MSIIPISNTVNIHPREEKTSIHSLSPEILVLIFSNLDVKDIAQAKVACKLWSVLTKDNSIWRVVAARLQWNLDASTSPFISANAESGRERTQSGSFVENGILASGWNARRKK
jgi:hypothetical protein